MPWTWAARDFFSDLLLNAEVVQRVLRDVA